MPKAHVRPQRPAPRPRATRADRLPDLPLPISRVRGSGWIMRSQGGTCGHRRRPSRRPRTAAVFGRGKTRASPKSPAQHRRRARTPTCCLMCIRWDPRASRTRSRYSSPQPRPPQPERGHRSTSPLSAPSPSPPSTDNSPHDGHAGVRDGGGREDAAVGMASEGAREVWVSRSDGWRLDLLGGGVVSGDEQEMMGVPTRPWR